MLRRTHKYTGLVTHYSNTAHKPEKVTQIKVRRKKTSKKKNSSKTYTDMRIRKELVFICNRYVPQRYTMYMAKMFMDI